jgi:type I site-specific restriction endonuclease
MDKRSLTERDICTKFVLPALKRAGWDEMLQIREEVYLTKARIIVRGKLVTRGKAKRRQVNAVNQVRRPDARAAGGNPERAACKCSREWRRA